MVTADVQLADSFGHEVKQKLSVFSFELQGVDYLAPIVYLMTLFIAWSSQTLDQAKIENKACSVRTTRSQSQTCLLSTYFLHLTDKVT